MAEVNDNSSIQLFEDQKIRTAWDAEKEEWYFSIIDVISVLTDTANPRRYWSDLKRKLKIEGAVEVYEKIVQLKLLSPDGKKRLTDVASTEQLLRIIQSIPSPKAEPFKAWLAMVGKERIEETIDPEQAIDRALDTYLKKGYSEEWIHQRLLAIRIRNELTDEWRTRPSPAGWGSTPRASSGSLRAPTAPRRVWNPAWRPRRQKSTTGENTPPPRP